MKYRKRPVVIEAIQWTGENWFKLEPFCGGAAHLTSKNRIKILLVDTFEGQFKAYIGDWIIKGVKGEYYPIKPDIFALTYEQIE